MASGYKWYKLCREDSYMLSPKESVILGSILATIISYSVCAIRLGVTEPNTSGMLRTYEEQFKVLVTHGNLTQDKTTGRFFLERDINLENRVE